MKERKVKLVLIGNIYYSGIVLDEDEHLLKIRDKFGVTVSVGKSQIISMTEEERE